MYALAFAKDGSFCVTTGLRFVKFWYFDSSGNLPLPKVNSFLLFLTFVFDAGAVVRLEWLE